MRVRLRQRSPRELAGAASDRAEERPLGIFGEARPREIGVEIVLKVTASSRSVR
jgi:hypothetical protein